MFGPAVGKIAPHLTPTDSTILILNSDEDDGPIIRDTKCGDDWNIYRGSVYEALNAADLYFRHLHSRHVKQKQCEDINCDV